MLLINTTPQPEPTPEEIRILSIDAWRYDSSWNWNDWHFVGTIPADCTEWSTRQLLKYFRENNFLTENSAGKCCIVDDGYNLEIRERATQRPLYAIEYGVNL